MKIFLAAISSFAFTMGLLTGCSYGQDAFNLPVERINPLFGITNVRVVDKGPLTVRSSNDRDRFGVVQLGSPRQPYLGEPRLLVTLPDGSLFDLSLQDAVPRLRQKKRFGDRPVQNYTWTWFDGINHFEPWPPGTEQLQLPPYEFYILNDTLVGFSVGFFQHPTIYVDGVKQPESTFVPRIGTREDNLVALPFSGSDYLQLFGQPERVRESFQE